MITRIRPYPHVQRFRSGVEVLFAAMVVGALVALRALEGSRIVAAFTAYVLARIAVAVFVPRLSREVVIDANTLRVEAAGRPTIGGFLIVPRERIRGVSAASGRILVDAGNQRLALPIPPMEPGHAADVAELIEDALRDR